MRAESIRCARVRESLLAADADSPLADELSEAHLRRCTRCAEVRAEVDLLRQELGGLRDTRLPTPPGALDELELLLDATDERAVLRRRVRVVATVSGLAVAASAGAGAIVVQSLHRRARLAG